MRHRDHRDTQKICVDVFSFFDRDVTTLAMRTGHMSSSSARYFVVFFTTATTIVRTIFANIGNLQTPLTMAISDEIGEIG
ncbi:hypothetical protein L484_014673 [Morus notabilis]|uniref:Uncharacterized protein n=1 Tax=Morus notabilis TaxID=981085 RepID=W9RUX3_9ROSA|nr:hypothetical protein L484_014673 [Morus notabilis]